MSKLKDILDDTHWTTIYESLMTWYQYNRPDYINDNIYKYLFLNDDGTIGSGNLIDLFEVFIRPRLHTYENCELSLTDDDAWEFILKTFYHSCFELLYRYTNWIFSTTTILQGYSINEMSALPIEEQNRVLSRSYSYEINEVVKNNDKGLKYVLDWIDEKIIYEIKMICIKIF